LDYIAKILRGVNGIAGADINAGGAINAFVRIDERDAADFRDSAFGAFAFTSAAVDASIGKNFVSHKFSYL